MDESCQYYTKGKDENWNDVEGCSWRKLVIGRDCENDCPFKPQCYTCRECGKEFKHGWVLTDHLNRSRTHRMTIKEYRKRYGLKKGEY